MTNNRAISLLTRDCFAMNDQCNCNADGCDDCHIYMSIKALEKQIPKPFRQAKVYNSESRQDVTCYYCSECNEEIENIAFIKYCPYCGQRMEDENEHSRN